MTVAPVRRAGSRHARWARPLLVAYGLVLAVVLFSPSSGTQSGLVLDLVRFLDWLGVPPSLVTFTRAEVVMNAVIIAPLTFLASLAVPRLRWQDWTTYAFLGSITVELVQGLLLPHRQASFSDIVANSFGALVGALLARLVSTPRQG